MLFLIPRIFRSQIIIFFSIKILNFYKNNNIFDMNMLNSRYIYICFDMNTLNNKKNNIYNVNYIIFYINT